MRRAPDALDASTPARPSGTSRRTSGRAWRRWLLSGVVVVAALLFVSARVYIGSLSESPLGLSAGAVAPIGPFEGRWRVAAGSVAGFRIEQTVLFMSGDIVGRTSGVSGMVTISDDAVAAASLSIDLRTVTAGGTSQPQFALSLDTAAYPTATFTLNRPVALPGGFAAGEMVNATATGMLSMHGTSREVTVTVSGRRDGPRVGLVGSIPFTLADWGISRPRGYGPLASVAAHGSAEFLVVLSRP